MAVQGSDPQRQDGTEGVRADAGRDREGDPGWHAPVPGTLQVYGNPWLWLLRQEVEALVRKKHGDDYLKDQQAKTELTRINRELKRLKTQIAVLEERKSKLNAGR